MQPAAHVQTSRPTTALITALFASIEAEEQAIASLMTAVDADDLTAVMAAARQLADLRRATTEYHCAA